jgi:hypothetical protein
MKEFKVMEFPEREGIVYVLCFIKGKKEVPFYVGESDVFHRRMAEYMDPQFSASTDFKVGEAIKYFQEKGYRIVVRWKRVAKKWQNEKRRKEEKKLIQELMWDDCRLLNSLKGYDYKTADKKAEREKILQFCSEIAR